MERLQEHVKQLRDKAAKYRSIARAMSDDETAARIFQLTAELERQANEMERGK
jgi:hypothetical protein